MLLNPNREFVYLRDNIDKRSNTATYRMRAFNDADYYYIEFFESTSFRQYPIETIVPSDILRLIRKRKAFLVLHNSHEAFHRVVPGIYQHLVLNAEIPPEQIILMSESADILDSVRRTSTELRLGMLRCEWIRSFEFSVVHGISHHTTIPVRALEDKPYAKKFVNFNRRWRPQRPLLVALLHIYGILDKGHVSLTVSDSCATWRNAIHMILYTFNCPELFRLIDENRESIESIPPLTVDVESLIENQAHVAEHSRWVYEDSYFNVVTETNYVTSPGYETGRFLSEKTFKPIIMGQPFIISSVPKMLPVLRSIGYKTFSPWIDESYDDELDDVKRMIKIVTEIKRLVELTPSELTEFLLAVRPICAHNRETIMNKKSHITQLN